MKKCSKGIKILAVIYVAVVLAIIAATAVEAKEPTFKSLYVPEGEWHNGGHLFIVNGGCCSDRLDNLQRTPEIHLQHGHEFPQLPIQPERTPAAGTEQWKMGNSGK